ncbi:MAG: AMP-dependent synthetase/ligase [Parashewanella sp.]
MSLEQFHPISLLRHQSRIRPSQIALEGFDEQGRWKQVTWQQFEQFSNRIAQWLASVGINTQDKCAIMSKNCPQWTCVDIGTIKSRAVVVPIYPTSTVEQAAFIVNDSQAKVLFVDDIDTYQQAIALKAQCPSLQHVIMFDDHDKLEENDFCIDSILALPTNASYQSEIKSRLQASKLDDLLTLIYTSGTTGDPKGVMLDLRNIAATIQQHDQKLKIGEGETSLAFLPLSHIFERGWSFYALCRGMRNVYLRDTNNVKEAIAAVRPHTMCVVPRFLEKVYSAIQDKVNNSSKTKRKLFAWALAVGEQSFEASQGRINASPLLKLQWQIANKLVFSKLQTALGGRIKFMPCGGAALEKRIGDFFQAIGVPVLCGYGMTETTATVTCNTVDNRVSGSNGQPLPQVQVKLGDNDEILVKGDTVMKGYYQRPKENAETFEDGWLKTGDAGRFDEQGNLFITDRIKELMKTSNGKYIAPQRVEGKVGCCPYIEQVAIVADAKNYVTALIVPAFETLEQWADQQGLKYNSQVELLRHSKVVMHFEQRLIDLQTELASFEKIKKFTLLNDAFSMEAGLITPTLKLRRKMIYHKYASEIRTMYQS